MVNFESDVYAKLSSISNAIQFIAMQAKVIQSLEDSLDKQMLLYKLLSSASSMDRDIVDIIHIFSKVSFECGRKLDVTN